MQIEDLLLGGSIIGISAYAVVELGKKLVDGLTEHGDDVNNRSRALQEAWEKRITAAEERLDATHKKLQEQMERESIARRELMEARVEIITLSNKVNSLARELEYCRGKESSNVKE